MYQSPNARAAAAGLAMGQRRQIYRREKPSLSHCLCAPETATVVTLRDSSNAASSNPLQHQPTMPPRPLNEAINADGYCCDNESLCCSEITEKLFTALGEPNLLGNNSGHVPKIVLIGGNYVSATKLLRKDHRKQELVKTSKSKNIKRQLHRRNLPKRKNSNNLQKRQGLSPRFLFENNEHEHRFRFGSSWRDFTVSSKLPLESESKSTSESGDNSETESEDSSIHCNRKDNDSNTVNLMQLEASSMGYTLGESDTNTEDASDTDTTNLQCASSAMSCTLGESDTDTEMQSRSSMEN